MSGYSATFFLDGTSVFRSAAQVNPVFYIDPDSTYRGGYITLQLDPKLSIDERVQVAERFAAAAVAWRDSLAARAQEQRTVADELTEARAEIARLKAESEGGEDL